tara:strand:- start:7116 stop:8297 length:1182 start_codon:yes stop_codon:yes gene_type:complete
MSTNVNKNAYTENEKSEKLSNFYCPDCDYYSVRISDYKKHLLTKKHKKNVSANVNKCKQNVNKMGKKSESFLKKSIGKNKIPTEQHLGKNECILKSKKLSNESFCQKTIRNNNIQTGSGNNKKIKRKKTKKLSNKKTLTYICQNCSKNYKSRQGLWKHQQKCKTQNLIIKNNDSEKDELLKQCLQTISKQTAVMEKFADMKSNSISASNNSNINSNNIGTQNNITLNVFLNEHCKDALNLEDFMKNIHFKLKDVLNGSSYVDNCVSVKLLNDLNEMPVTKRPIHCTDQRRKNFVVKDKEEGWIKEKGSNGGKIQKEIDKLYDKAYVEFYHAYDDKHPYPHNSIQEDLKQQTSHTINKKKDKHTILGSVAKTVDVKEAMEEFKDIENKKIKDVN